MTKDEIRAARQRAGLTQQATADLLGVHPSTYRQWEYGKRKPSAAAVRLLESLRELKPAIPMTREEIIQVRQRAGLTQQAMAELIGVNVTTYLNWEVGRKKPRQSAVRLIQMLRDGKLRKESKG